MENELHVGDIRLKLKYRQCNCNKPKTLFPDGSWYCPVHGYIRGKMVRI